jgi:hypothetical protein
VDRKNLELDDIFRRGTAHEEKGAVYRVPGDVFRLEIRLERFPDCGLAVVEVADQNLSFLLRVERQYGGLRPERRNIEIEHFLYVRKLKLPWSAR